MSHLDLVRNIADWQEVGVKIFRDSHIECGEKEVSTILANILGLSPLELYLKINEPVDERKGYEISQALEKRLKGMPIQYIFGAVEFFSLPFYLKPGVFIPRPETELLVEEGLKILKDLSPGLVLDLGTGSGNIALSLLKNSQAKAVAADISPLALEVARENAKAISLDKIEFLEGDMFTPLEAALPKARLRPPWGDLPLTGFTPLKAFDLIISNPPYLDRKEWSNLPREVKYYEPREALWGGEDGLSFYRRLAGEAGKFLKIGGYLLLEVGPAMAVASLLKEEGWQDIKIIKDYNNRDRIISCKNEPSHG